MPVVITRNEDSEITNIVKSTGIDPNFANAGEKSGLQIWKIQNFKPVLQPKSEYGKFYSGNSYIILNTRRNGDKVTWTGHSWLGQKISEDDATSATTFVDQLNAKLGGMLQQHQETQKNESGLFLSYFKNGIQYLPDRESSQLQQAEINLIKPGQLHHMRRKRSPEDMIEEELHHDDHKMAEDLFHAAKDGDLESVKYFVDEKHVPVDDVLIATGETALLKAAQGCHLNVIEFLVKSGADVHHRDKWGYTALHWAADQYAIDMGAIEFLVSSGADVKLQDGVAGYTPLHWAAYHCNLPAVKFLVAKGADAHSKSRTEETPIDLAAQNGCLGVVEYFMKEKAASLDVFKATNRGYADAVKFLIEKKGKPATATDGTGWTLLHRAAYNGHLDIVKYLVERKKVNVNMKNKDNKYPVTPLHAATETGHLSVVKYLVEKHADVKAEDADGRTPLYWAANHGFQNVIKFFIDNKADVNQKDKHGNTLLHAAASNGNPIVVQYLVEEKGMDVNAKNEDGDTPLSIALQRDGSFDVSQYLLREKGADFKTKNGHGSTPLHVAAQKGYLDVVKYLVEHGADIKAKNTKGETPVYRAIEHGYLDLTKFFVDEMKADCEERDGQGHTLLHAAVHSGNLPLVKYLVEDKGVSVDAKDDKGVSLLVEAQESKKSDIVAYLESKTAHRNRRSVDAGDATGSLRPTNPTTNSANGPWIGGPRVDWTSKSTPVALPSADGEVALPIMSNLFDGISLLLDVGLRLLTGNSHKQPVHESLLTSTELIERRIDYNATGAVEELSEIYNELDSE